VQVQSQLLNVTKPKKNKKYENFKFNSCPVCVLLASPKPNGVLLGCWQKAVFYSRLITKYMKHFYCKIFLQLTQAHAKA
jgi:hypothetical protein